MNREPPATFAPLPPPRPPPRQQQQPEREGPAADETGDDGGLPRPLPPPPAAPLPVPPQVDAVVVRQAEAALQAMDQGFDHGDEAREYGIAAADMTDEDTLVMEEKLFVHVAGMTMGFAGTRICTVHSRAYILAEAIYRARNPMRPRGTYLPVEAWDELQRLTRTTSYKAAADKAAEIIAASICLSVCERLRPGWAAAQLAASRFTMGDLRRAARPGIGLVLRADNTNGMTPHDERLVIKADHDWLGTIDVAAAGAETRRANRRAQGKLARDVATRMALHRIKLSTTTASLIARALCITVRQFIDALPADADVFPSPAPAVMTQFLGPGFDPGEKVGLTREAALAGDPAARTHVEQEEERDRAIGALGTAPATAAQPPAAAAAAAARSPSAAAVAQPPAAAAAARTSPPAATGAGGAGGSRGNKRAGGPAHDEAEGEGDDEDGDDGSAPPASRRQRTTAPPVEDGEEPQPQAQMPPPAANTPPRVARSRLAATPAHAVREAAAAMTPAGVPCCASPVGTPLGAGARAALAAAGDSRPLPVALTTVEGDVGAAAAAVVRRVRGEDLGLLEAWASVLAAGAGSSRSAAWFGAQCDQRCRLELAVPSASFLSRLREAFAGASCLLHDVGGRGGWLANHRVVTRSAALCLGMGEAFTTAARVDHCAAVVALPPSSSSSAAAQQQMRAQVARDARAGTRVLSVWLDPARLAGGGAGDASRASLPFVLELAAAGGGDAGAAPIPLEHGTVVVMAADGSAGGLLPYSVRARDGSSSGSSSSSQSGLVASGSGGGSGLAQTAAASPTRLVELLFFVSDGVLAACSASSAADVSREVADLVATLAA